MHAQRLQQHAATGDSPLELQQVPEPRPQAGQLLLKVLACGVCHTDLHTIEGELRPPELPITPGHQVVGEAPALGNGVDGWAIGELAG